MRRPVIAAALVVAGAVAAVALGSALPWHGSGKAARDDEEMTVERATLRPGRIVLTVRGEAERPVHVAQVMVDDAFVDFLLPRGTVARHARTTLTIDYPWLEGEAYEIDVLTSTGSMVEYEIPSAHS